MVEKRKAMHREILAEYGTAPGFLRQTIPYQFRSREKWASTEPHLTAVKPNSIASKAYRGLFVRTDGRERFVTITSMKTGNPHQSSEMAHSCHSAALSPAWLTCCSFRTSVTLTT